MEKYKDRKHCLLLYPSEDETHKKALELIRKNYDYACIVHDSDVGENGEIKKSHTHIVLRFKNPVYNTALAKDLGITDNYIEKCRNIENSLLYLIHYNDMDKFQYDLDLVEGTLKEKMRKIIENYGKDENDKSLELVEYIEQSEIISIEEFSKYCAKMGKWDVFRRSAVIYLELIREHNKKQWK